MLVERAHIGDPCKPTLTFFTKGIDSIIHPEIRMCFFPLLDGIKQISVGLVQHMDDAVAGHLPGNNV